MAGAAERGVSVGCVRRDGDGAGGGSSLQGSTNDRGRRRRRHGLDDRRRTTRAGVELSGAREWVPRLRLHCAAARALSLALVISASVTLRRPASSTSVDLSRFLSPNPPLSLYLTPAGLVTRADFLFVVRVALIGRDRPLLLTYFFSEGT